MKNTHFIARFPSRPVQLALGMFFSLVVASLSSHASAKHAPSPAPTPEWDFIVFEAKSWGAPISSWRIMPTGGSWTEVQREPNAPLADYKLVWHDLESDDALFGELTQILRSLPDPAPDSNDCENFMTDAAYGTIRLTRGATTTEIAWNSGCMDEDYVAFLDILKRADQTVAARGRAGPVLRVEDGAEQR